MVQRLIQHGVVIMGEVAEGIERSCIIVIVVVVVVVVVVQITFEIKRSARK